MPLGALPPERQQKVLPYIRQWVATGAGLSAAQVDVLREQHGVYLVRSGRMCVAGLNSGNVEPTAEAIAAVLGG